MRSFPLKSVLAGVTACLLGSSAFFGAAAAETNIWLPEGSQTGAKGEQPKELLTTGKELKGKSLYGRLLFNSPSVLGEKAVRIGLSCNSCHPAGHVNTSFFISGLSETPGTIDLTNSFWKAGGEDGKFNPVAIPTLRDVRNTAPYGTAVIHKTLPAFTGHVISTEFGGDPPSDAVMDALISYMNLLESETSKNMSIQAEAIPLSDFFSLLDQPIAEQDTEETEHLVFLIKEELGRRLDEKNKDQLVAAVRTLKQIQKYLISNPSKANEAYSRLF